MEEEEEGDNVVEGLMYGPFQISVDDDGYNEFMQRFIQDARAQENIPSVAGSRVGSPPPPPPPPPPRAGSEYSWCSAAEIAISTGTSWGDWKKIDEEKSPKSSPYPIHVGRVVSLSEYAAYAVALSTPFEIVERYNPPVPDALQTRIAYWSFADNEADIRLYSCLANCNSNEFFKGEELYNEGAVSDLLQIGFYLTAMVKGNEDGVCESHTVGIMFDRRRVTDCKCTCKDPARWCSHVVSVALYRINMPEQVVYRPPISETLSRLCKDKLQEYAQLLISELPLKYLRTCQNLLDDVLSANKEKVDGAPDPTIGAAINDPSSWCLDKLFIKAIINKILDKFCIVPPVVIGDVNSLNDSAPPAATEWANFLRPLRSCNPEPLWNLLMIIRELFTRSDRNAIFLLETVTEKIMSCPQIIVWWFAEKTLLTGDTGYQIKNYNANTNAYLYQLSACRICDEVVLLWRQAVLNPSISPGERFDLRVRFKNWHLTILDMIWNYSDLSSFRNHPTPADLCNFPGFRSAIAASNLNWDNHPIKGVTYKECIEFGSIWSYNPFTVLLTRGQTKYVSRREEPMKTILRLGILHAYRTYVIQKIIKSKPVPGILFTADAKTQEYLIKLIVAAGINGEPADEATLKRFSERFVSLADEIRKPQKRTRLGRRRNKIIREMKLYDLTIENHKYLQDISEDSNNEFNVNGSHNGIIKVTKAVILKSTIADRSIRERLELEIRKLNEEIAKANNMRNIVPNVGESKPKELNYTNSTGSNNYYNATNHKNNSNNNNNNNNNLCQNTINDKSIVDNLHLQNIRLDDNEIDNYVLNKQNEYEDKENKIRNEEDDKNQCNKIYANTYNEYQGETKNNIKVNNNYDNRENNGYYDINHTKVHENGEISYREKNKRYYNNTDNKIAIYNNNNNNNNQHNEIQYNNTDDKNINQYNEIYDNTNNVYKIDKDCVNNKRNNNVDYIEVKNDNNKIINKECEQNDICDITSDENFNANNKNHGSLCNLNVEKGKEYEEPIIINGVDQYSDEDDDYDDDDDDDDEDDDEDDDDDKSYNEFDDPIMRGLKKFITIDEKLKSIEYEEECKKRGIINPFTDDVTLESLKRCNITFGDEENLNDRELLIKKLESEKEEDNDNDNDNDTNNDDNNENNNKEKGKVQVPRGTRVRAIKSASVVDDFVNFFVTPTKYLFIESNRKNFKDDEDPGDPNYKDVADGIFVNDVIDGEFDTLYARVEGLYSHGHKRLAQELALGIVQKMVDNPIILNVRNADIVIKGRKKKLLINPVLHLVTLKTIDWLKKCLYLIKIYNNADEFHSPVFRLGLQALELARLPASVRPLEVMLMNLEHQVLECMKPLVLAREDLEILCARASEIVEDTYNRRGNLLMPYSLASYMFEFVICDYETKIKNDIIGVDEQGVLFDAALVTLAKKLSFSEAEYPLLCEGLRIERADLAIKLLIHFKNNESYLAKVMEVILDKSLDPYMKSPRPHWFSTYGIYANIKWASQVRTSNPSSLSNGQHNATVPEDTNSNLRDIIGLVPGPSSTVSAPASLSDSSYSHLLTSLQDTHNRPASVNGVSRLRQRTGRGRRTVPLIPNLPSEALVHWSLSLAKQILRRFGIKNSNYVCISPFDVVEPQESLQMCAILLILHSIGISNLINSSNWQMRTYSSVVNWLSGVAIEIGSKAIILITENWIGHLTPSESLALADRVSRVGELQTERLAAELALSCLPFAAILNTGEITRALMLCKENGELFLSQSLLVVEYAARTPDGDIKVYPDVILHLSKLWSELFIQLLKQSDSVDTVITGCFQTKMYIDAATAVLTTTNEHSKPPVKGFMRKPLMFCISIPNLPLQYYTKETDLPVSERLAVYLTSSYRTGIMYLEALHRRIDYNRTIEKHMRIPSPTDDVLGLLNIAMKLGDCFVYHFIMCVERCILNPFILYQVAAESAAFLSRNNPQTTAQFLRSNFSPIIDKCHSIFAQYFKQKFVSMSPAEENEFIKILAASQQAFYVSPNGITYYKQIVHSLRRLKVRSKEFWFRLNNAVRY